MVLRRRTGKGNSGMPQITWHTSFVLLPLRFRKGDKERGCNYNSRGEQAVKISCLDADVAYLL
jgi:hypothetical protein